jgi:hypothetical protein
VFLALGAWPPIGLALALGIGELTGCARFAATCSSASSFSAWVVVAQITIVSVLLLAVPLARIGTFGSLAILLAALPIVALLVAAGATYDPEAGTAALLTMLAIAWVVGVVVGWRGSSRRMPP